MPYDTNLNPGAPPLLWSSVKEAFDKINENFEIIAATIGDGSGLVPVNFTDLNSNLVPASNAAYDLGSPTKRWNNLYLASTSLSLGSVAIQVTDSGTAIALPSGSTVGGKLIRNPDESSFRNVAVAGQDTITSDDFTDTLTVANGAGITLTTNAATDTITITNSGVVELNGTAGEIGVSSSSGSYTLTNLGVKSAVGGLGITVTSPSGDVTFNNSGVVNLNAGFGIGVSLKDPSGVVTITNTAPGGNTYRSIAVAGNPTLTANSAAATITYIAGSGISLTTTPATFFATDRVTVANTGVTSLSVSPAFTLNSNTGDLVLEFAGNTDIVGSVYGEDSSILVDASSGTFHGDLTGSVFDENSTMLIDATSGRIVGPISIDIADLSIAGGSAGQLLSTDGNGNHTWLTVTSGPGGELIAVDSYIFKVAAEDSVERVINSGETVKFVGANTISVSSDDEGLITITGPDLGAFTFTGSVFDTNDSSGITVVTATTFNSDVTVENELFVPNRISAGILEAAEIRTTGTALPEIQSETNLNLTAGNAVVITSSPLRLAQFTTADRDLLTAQNGDLIYNITVNKFQGYAGGTWVDLH
jgi:hypothetical protein